MSVTLIDKLSPASVPASKGTKSLPPLVRRRIAFVLAATDQGPMIMNRLDGLNGGGVAAEYLETGAYDPHHLRELKERLRQRCGISSTMPMMIDGGANIGAYTIPLSRWGGFVYAIEPQQHPYWALCGNLALNNCFNVQPVLGALHSKTGMIDVPKLNPLLATNFGGLSLNPALDDPSIGQPIDRTKTVQVPCFAIDDWQLPRLDLLKLDIEGMELEALIGAKLTIERYKPIIFAETFLSHSDRILSVLGPGWKETEVSTVMSFFTYEAV